MPFFLLIPSEWIPTVPGRKMKILSIAYGPYMAQNILASAGTHHGETSWTVALSLLPQNLPLTALLLECSFLLPSFPAVLYSDFRTSAGILLSWEPFPDSREVKSSVTEVPKCPGLPAQCKSPPVVWCLPLLFHWSKAPGLNLESTLIHAELTFPQDYTNNWKCILFYFLISVSLE